MAATFRVDAQGRQIIGRFTGPAFAFGASEAGTLGPKDDVAVIFTSIANILSTPKGSIPYDPNLGSVIPHLLFEIVDDVTMSLIRHFARKDLEDQETRIVVNNVQTARIGDFSIRVMPSVSIVGDPLGRVLNAPLTFIREGGF
jgi:phage baseplate assembly protein W